MNIFALLYFCVVEMHIIMQLMHSFEVNIRICKFEEVKFTEAKPWWTSFSRVDKSSY